MVLFFLTIKDLLNYQLIVMMIYNYDRMRGKPRLIKIINDLRGSPGSLPIESLIRFVVFCTMSIVIE